jgi:hypothetical protein
MSSKHPKLQRVVNGVLLSELDDVEVLAPEFDALRDRFDEAQVEYQSGALRPKAYADLLATLPTEIDGVIWTMGAKSGRWYQKRAGGWVPGTPVLAENYVETQTSIHDVDDSAEKAIKPTVSLALSVDPLGDYLDAVELGSDISDGHLSSDLPALDIADTVLPGPDAEVEVLSDIAELSGTKSSSEPIQYVAPAAAISLDDILGPPPSEPSSDS